MHDWRLLRKYAEDDSQAAFAALVRRYTDLVYCTCLRELGDPSLAEDATQAVFLVLARKTASLQRGATLSSWLFQNSPPHVQECASSRAATAADGGKGGHTHGADDAARAGRLGAGRAAAERGT